MASASKCLAQTNKSPDVGEATKKHSALRDAAGREGPSIRTANLPRLGSPPAPKAGASSFGEFMTSDNSLSLILRRLDEIERKLDHVLEELRTPHARCHRLFGTPGQSSKEG